MQPTKPTFKTNTKATIHANGRGYTVRVNGRVIKCHNFATASFYARSAKA